MATFPDWGEVFPLTDFPLALADDPEFHWRSPSMVRGLFVDLATVAAALPGRHEPAGATSVHADVVRVDSAFPIAAARFLVHARRIEIAPGARIEFGPPAGAGSRACAIELFADEWASATGDAQPALSVGGENIMLGSELDSGGISVAVEEDGSVTIGEIGCAPFGDALTGAVELAAARRLVHAPADRRDSTRALALAIARWLARTGGDPLLRGDARSLAAHLVGADAGAALVPTLRYGEYKQLAIDTRDAIAQIARVAADLLNRQLGLDDQRGAACNLLAHYKAEHQRSARRIEQATHNLEDARHANEISRAKLAACEAALTDTEKAFRNGIEQKKAEMTRKAVFAALLAVVEIGGGIALACTGNPAGAAAAATGVATVAKASQATASKLARLVELLKRICKILEAIQKVKKFADMLMDISSSIRDPIAARKRAEGALDDIPERPTDAASMTAADCDEMLFTIEYAFGDALQEGIAGAEAHLVQLKRLVIRAKEVVDTTADMERSAQALQCELWESMRAEQDIAGMRSTIDQLDESIRPGFILYSYYQRLHDRLKLRMLGAIQDISDSYRYYALRAPPPLPPFATDAAQLAMTVSDLEQALVTAREDRGVISEWGPEGIDASNHGLIQFRDTGEIDWMVPFDNFGGLDRIRITEIEVWLEGVVVPPGESLFIVIETTGRYRDRDRGQTFEFASVPLRRVFKYHFSEPGTARDPWGRGVVITMRANDAEGAFFEPTPFTTWRVSLPAAQNPRASLSATTGLRLEFIGTAKAGMLRAARGAGRESLIRQAIEL